MQLKNIVLILSIITIPLQSLSVEQTPMTKKEIALKAATIACHTTELGFSGFVLVSMQYDGRMKGLVDIALDMGRSDYKEVFNGVAYHIPPLITFCHGAYGLVREIKPLIKMYQEKRKSL